MLSIAMDASPERARPFVEGRTYSFPTVLDSQAELARLYDFDAIPNGLLVDESGILRYQHYSGFDVRRPEIVEQLEELLATPAGEVPPLPSLRQQSAEVETLLAEASGRPDDPEVWLALADVHMSEGHLVKAASAYERALAIDSDSAPAHFGLGTVRRQQGDNAAALALWKRALWKDPASFVIRKQIWALEFPEKFWPEIDYEWQRQRLAQEAVGAFPDIAPPPK